MWSRPSSAWWISSVKRCLRAWTQEIPLSQEPNRGPSWQSSLLHLTRTVHVKADYSLKTLPLFPPSPSDEDPRASGPYSTPLFSYFPTSFCKLVRIIVWRSQEQGWEVSEILWDASGPESNHIQQNTGVSDSLQPMFLNVPNLSPVVSWFLSVVLQEGFDGVHPQSAI